MKKSLKIRWIIITVLAIISLIGIITARLSVSFADWYAFNVYPIIQNTVSWITGLLPFSLTEIIIFSAVIAGIGLIVFFIIRIIKPKGKRKDFLLSSSANLLLTASIIGFIFVFNCGINYHRSPFSAYSGITVEKYTKEQVCEVLEYTIAQVNTLSNEIELDENGSCILPENYLDTTSAAMKNLAAQYPVLDSYYPHAKPVLHSRLWCYTKIVGMFFPFTVEANFNTCDTNESIGLTICHELSHLTGFMREDEANFIAYMACRESDDKYLMYSGYYHTMCQLLNAYAREVGDNEYARVWQLINPITVNQIRMENEYWKQFDTPVAEISNTINDTYLKVNNQTDGAKSYGRMIDLVMAEYYQNKGE